MYYNNDGTQLLDVGEQGKLVNYGVATILAAKPAGASSRAMGWAKAPGQHVADYGFSAEAVLRRNMDGGRYNLYLAESAQDMVKINANGGSFTNPKYGNVVEEIWLGYGKTVFDGTGVDSEGYGGKFAMENPGCTFSHWSTESNCASEGQERLELMLEASEHPRYWAIWNVPITWEPNGGHWEDPEDRSSRTSVHLTRNPAGGYEGSQIPFREGYAFKGWGFGEGAAAVDAFQEVNPVTKLTVYAVWAPASYTIALDANCEGAEVNPAEIATVNGADVVLPVPTAVFGYCFLGRWSTERDGSGESYEAGLQEGLRLAEVEGARVTLYAQWRAVMRVDVPIRVDFDLAVNEGGGTVGVTAAGAGGLGYATCSFASHTPEEVRVSAASQCSDAAGDYRHAALAAFARGDAAKATNLEQVRLSISGDSDGANRVSASLAELYGDWADAVGDGNAVGSLDLGSLGLVVPSSGLGEPGLLNVRFSLDCTGLPLEDVALGESFPLLKLVYTMELADA